MLRSQGAGACDAQAQCVAQYRLHSWVPFPPFLLLPQPHNPQLSDSPNDAHACHPKDDVFQDKTLVASTKVGEHIYASMCMHTHMHTCAHVYIHVHIHSLPSLTVQQMLSVHGVHGCLSLCTELLEDTVPSLTCLLVCCMVPSVSSFTH